MNLKFAEWKWLFGFVNIATTESFGTIIPIISRIFGTISSYAPDARSVSSWMRKTGNDAVANGINRMTHYNRYIAASASMVGDATSGIESS